MIEPDRTLTPIAPGSIGDKDKDLQIDDNLTTNSNDSDNPILTPSDQGHENVDSATLCVFDTDATIRSIARSDATKSPQQAKLDLQMMEDPVRFCPSLPGLPSGAAVTRPGFRRAHSGSLSSRRPALRLMLSSQDQSDFSAAVQEARNNLVSDAKMLPKSTNMGLGSKGPPQHAIKAQANAGKSTAPAPPPPGLARPKESKPWPIPQPVADEERPRILTEHEQTIKAHDSQSHSWEESETFERKPSPVSRSPDSPKRQAVFLRAIPCMYVHNVANAVSFYKDILGFSLLGKPDSSHASLARTSTPPNSGPQIQKRGSTKQLPTDAVQLYIRIAPMGPSGEREKPPATTLWIMVSDVDEVFAELEAKWAKFQPRANEYFPMHSFGDAKILAKPQNKAWGNRELHVIDGDENKIIFFKELH